MQLVPKPARLVLRAALIVSVTLPASLFAQLTPVPVQPRMGQPVAGLSPAELARFAAGRVDFDTDLQPPPGPLGPIFNNNGCGACHVTPLGGSGTVTVTRFGRYIKDVFDPMEELGGSLLQAEAISPECEEVIPPGTEVEALRVTNSTLGMGLVEAIPDSALEANQMNPPGGVVSGRVHWVIPLEDPESDPRAGRFGWKAQVATALTFAGDAALNEMGLTNRLVPTENAPNGNLELLAQCDSIPDPEDGPDANGLHFIDRITDFQRFLAAPPQTPRSGMSGEALFMSVHCGDCHVPSFTTADLDTLEPALRNKTIKPYSDFLLHDMGLLGDGIVQGDAADREMRTPSLWGLRVRNPLLHNATVTGGTFADRIIAAVAAHGAFLSEAVSSATMFANLTPEQKAAVIAFLESLGLAEFDHNGDNAINLVDLPALNACTSGPLPVYNPDHACAVSDINQDNDVDLFDLASFQNAFFVLTLP